MHRWIQVLDTNVMPIEIRLRSVEARDKIAGFTLNKASLPGEGECQ